MTSVCDGNNEITVIKKMKKMKIMMKMTMMILNIKIMALITRRGRIPQRTIENLLPTPTTAGEEEEEEKTQKHKARILLLLLQNSNVISDHAKRAEALLCPSELPARHYQPCIASA